nr:hypothetical protein [uncultured Acetatifactor sp.]
MTGAGGGKGWQSMTAFRPWFGNPSAHAENGKLVHPMLDGSTRGWVSFMNELCEMGTLAPDWFTIDWETAKSYMLQNRLGALYYPAANLYLEIVRSHDWDYSLASSWEYLPDLPEGMKGTAGGNAGYLWAIPKSNVEGDQGKLLRILHIMDAMCYGGDCHFETVQGGGNEVHDIDICVREYLEDGLSYCTTPTEHPGFDGTYGTTNLNLAPWQTFGYTVKWQLEYTPEDAGEDQKMYVDKINNGKKVIASYDRWPNDNLLSAVNINEIAPNLSEYELQQQYKFVTGERSMDEWDDFVTEWLNQGGRDVLAAQAEKLGVELPDEAK